MIRRDLILGGGALFAAGASFYLTPRKRQLLAAGISLEKAVPRAFGGWQSETNEGIVVPKDENDLASRLYSQVVTRAFQRDGHYVMVLIAYGDTQSDLLQLHRPEVCYQAFGFDIKSDQKAMLQTARMVVIPVRQLEAVADSRTEFITYWTRMGEDMPTDNREQRWVKLRNQFAGVIPDGVLVRVSSFEPERAASLALNSQFIAEFLAALEMPVRRALVGSQRASRMT